MLDLQECGLVVVDVQGRLAQLMYDREILFKNIRILIQAARILDIPILWCQQCPDALGPTVPEISELLCDTQPINKSSFSCCGDERFNAALQDLGRKQILLCGIEAHVCIYQTAVDLLRMDYEVSVIGVWLPMRFLREPAKIKRSALPQPAPKAPKSAPRKWRYSSCSEPPTTPNSNKSPNW
jgi:hypothetical protein